MPAKRTRQREESTVPVTLQWGDILSLPTLYANQVYISHAGPEFYIVFGEVQVPVLTNAQPGQLHELTVRPVARLAVTPEAMMQIADAVARNVAAYQEHLADSRKEE